MLDLAGDGFDYTGLQDSTAYYDLDGDGQLEQTAWVGSADALLGFDANGDGLISGREELVLSDYVEGAETDLEGLVAFDSNGNGLFDVSDDQWQDFRVWQDANSDGVSSVDELRTLDELGIESVSLISDDNERVLENGTVVEHGQFEVTYTDGSRGIGADVAFDYRDNLADMSDPSGGALL